VVVKILRRPFQSVSPEQEVYKRGCTKQIGTGARSSRKAPNPTGALDGRQ